MPGSLSPSRTLKALGAAALLMSVAGCNSSDETAQQQEHQADGISANSEQAEASGSSESSAPPKDIDYRTILDGITYKGQPVVVRSPEQIEEFIQMTRDAEAENAVDNVNIDPPECEEAITGAAAASHADRMNVDNFTMADLDIDSFTLIAEASDIADYRIFDDGVDKDKCSSYTYEAHGVTQEITQKELPFNADAEKGAATLQHSVFDDGMEFPLYSLAAVKNGAFITIALKDDSEESIQAANETLDQVLARL